MNTDKEKYTDPLSDILMNIPEGTTGSSIVSSIMSLSSALVYQELYRGGYRGRRIICWTF